MAWSWMAFARRFDLARANVFWLILIGATASAWWLVKSSVVGMAFAGAAGLAGFAVSAGCASRLWRITPITASLMASEDRSRL
jgi:hypothetical protein